jgi:shikimate dehydrogenase
VGAVNVARQNPDGSWHGDMLDGLAFVAAQKKQGAKLEGAWVPQIGAGGVGSYTPPLVFLESSKALPVIPRS